MDFILDKRAKMQESIETYLTVREGFIKLQTTCINTLREGEDTLHQGKELLSLEGDLQLADAIDDYMKTINYLKGILQADYDAMNQNNEEETLYTMPGSKKGAASPKKRGEAEKKKNSKK